MKPLHDIHTHNFLSSCCFDPTASVENFIKRSKENGLRLLGFSNHTWDETVPGASPWYKKQSVTYALQIRAQIPKEVPGLKVLVGVETEYFGMTGILGMGKEAAQKFDYILIPHTHIHMRNYVMRETEDITRTRREIADKFVSVGISEEIARSLAGKLRETELEPYITERKVDYIRYASDFMVKSFRGLLQNETLRSYPASLPVSIAHPFQPVGDDDKKDEMLRLISDNTFGELFSETAKRGIGLEINPWSDSPEYLRMFGIAKECGNKFTLGSDSHSCNCLADIFKTSLCTDPLGITEDDLMEFVRI